MIFTRSAVERVLAEASPSLRAAGITDIFFDPSGAGWTQEYVFTIFEAAPVTKTVVPYRPVARPDGSGYDKVDLPPTSIVVLGKEARNAVAAALIPLDVPDQIQLAFRAGRGDKEQLVDQVWPADVMIQRIVDEIRPLEQRIEQLRGLQ